MSQKINTLVDLQMAQLQKKSELHEKKELIKLKWKTFTHIERGDLKVEFNSSGNLVELIKSGTPFLVELAGQLLLKKYLQKSNSKIKYLLGHLSSFMVSQLSLFLEKKMPSSK